MASDQELQKIKDLINKASDLQEPGEPEEDAVLGRVPQDPNDDEAWGYLAGLQDAYRILQGMPPAFRKDWE